MFPKWWKKVIILASKSNLRHKMTVIGRTGGYISCLWMAPWLCWSATLIVNELLDRLVDHCYVLLHSSYVNIPIAHVPWVGLRIAGAAARASWRLETSQLNKHICQNITDLQIKSNGSTQSDHVTDEECNTAGPQDSFEGPLIEEVLCSPEMLHTVMWSLWIKCLDGIWRSTVCAGKYVHWPPPSRPWSPTHCLLLLLIKI